MPFVLLPVSAGLTLYRDRITGNSREVPVGPPITHPTQDHHNPSQSGSICDLRDPSFWVYLVFPLTRIWDSAARKLCRAKRKKKKLIFSLGWRTDTRNDFCQISRFWSSWIWQGNSRQRTLQKPVIELFLLYSFCTILMRKQNKNMTLKWNFYFISQVEPLKSTLDVF